MDKVREAVEEILKDIRPLLKGAGRDIAVVEATENSAMLRLEGFCSGCACGESYRDGLREMFAAKIPGLTVRFE